MSETPVLPPAPSPVVTQTSALAIASLVGGILSWSAAPFVGAVVAIITGHMAKGEIRAARGLLTGDGMATVGLLLGYLQLAFGLLAVCAVLASLALGLSLPLLCIPFSNTLSG